VIAAWPRSTTRPVPEAGEVWFAHSAAGPQTGLVPVLLTTEPDCLRLEDGLVNDPLDRPMLR
jgi:hypothetical protein